MAVQSNQSHSWSCLQNTQVWLKVIFCRPLDSPDSARVTHRHRCTKPCGEIWFVSPDEVSQGQCLNRNQTKPSYGKSCVVYTMLSHTTLQHVASTVCQSANFSGFFLLLIAKCWQHNTCQIWPGSHSANTKMFPTVVFDTIQYTGTRTQLITFDQTTTG